MRAAAPKGRILYETASPPLRRSFHHADRHKHFGVGTCDKVLLTSYTSPTILLAAAALVLCFAQLSIPPCFEKLIKVAAPLAFSVYLIHAHPLIWEYGMADRFSVLAAKTPPVMLLLVLGAALGIYVICSLMDVLCVWIFRLLHMDELSQRVEAGTSACLGRWLDKE